MHKVSPELGSVELWTGHHNSSLDLTSSCGGEEIAARGVITQKCALYVGTRSLPYTVTLVMGAIHRVVVLVGIFLAGIASPTGARVGLTAVATILVV